VHRCYPGTGCICIPNRTDIEALAAWVRASGLREITVSNWYSEFIDNSSRGKISSLFVIHT
jgi:hypothetical protein